MAVEKRINRAQQWHRMRMIENPLVRHSLALLVLLYIFWSMLSINIGQDLGGYFF
mgnify:CR=1 FL=1